ncbi:Predicted dithiol-disulfide isomerase, DsbA family [Nakamurella panacisegetis]|uniref:Predicted dithiol-disulfide isomerase, DsbA family n=1 Tax=Nakamurella panacisegetis TaxID=1090615 RepID=A0A1H0IP53_9ACTN|nr:DsbA family oxidoreductase [Nakamurella panacisegetis]SDO33274.1 Predicted dithiol-disulfide isomerase, DsbA family [Nakamurella panacisegetis]
MKIDIWSDVVCPWCYLGKRRFESALRQFAHRDDVSVTWHSFQLDPTAASASPGSDHDHIQAIADKLGLSREKSARMHDDLTATAAAEGLDYHFEKMKAANTFDAHRLLHLALARGRQDVLKERLMKATFTDGLPVGDHGTLADLAVEAGLDRAEVEAALAGDRYADDVRADIAQARAYGISGVPFFVIDAKYGVSGAQPAPALLDVLNQAWSDAHPLTMTAGNAGSCEGDTCSV